VEGVIAISGHISNFKGYFPADYTFLESTWEFVRETKNPSSRYFGREGSSKLD